MPVKKEPSGRRSVHAEVEVSGTPEEVWKAIASGPGITSWFVPTTLEERLGGTTASSFGPGMDSVARITVWEPPRRFVAETQEEGPGTVATEWTVEAKAGGTCTVRVVHSWFASSDDWDHQFEGHTYGWKSFFEILRLYLAHFRGMPCSPIHLAAMSTDAKAWDLLVQPLGFANARVGARVTTPDDAPALSGVVEVVSPPQWPGLLLRLDKPAPALAHVFALPMGGEVMLPVRFYLYGPLNGDVAKDVETNWQAWLGRHFPPSR